MGQLKVVEGSAENPGNRSGAVSLCFTEVDMSN